MRDPFLRHVVQPVVDALGIDPRRAGEDCAYAFLVLAIGLAALRHATIDAAIRPEMPMKEVYAVVGAAMLTPWMAWTARNAPASVAGTLGIVASAMRTLLLACALIDLVNLVAIIDTADVAVVRCTMQGAGSLAGALSLYLAASQPPPPRRRPALA